MRVNTDLPCPVCLTGRIKGLYRRVNAYPYPGTNVEVEDLDHCGCLTDDQAMEFIVRHVEGPYGRK